MIKVSLISLGCAKNLVDSEIMVGHLHQAGMAVIPEAEKADVVIFNTCSFIDSSKEESIGHILEVHQNRGMRIDLVLCTPDVADRVTDVWIDVEERAKPVTSDHAPVWVEIAV